MKKLIVYLIFSIGFSIYGQSRINAPETANPLEESTPFLIKDNNRSYAIRFDAVRAALKTYFDGFYNSGSNDGVIQSVSFSNNLLTFTGTTGAFSGSVDLSSISATDDGIDWQTDITSDVVFDGSEKGLTKLYPIVNSKVTINKGSYVKGDVICFHRKSGIAQIERGVDVRLNGVRDVNNQFFINDVGANALVQFSHLEGSTLVGNVIGNISNGYEGAVITTNYTELREGDTGVNLTINGAGLSNALISFSTGVTLNSIVSTSNNEMIVNVDVTGLENDVITPTFDNGDISVDTDAITIAAAPPALPTYADYTAWYEFETLTPNDEGGNYNGTNNGASTTAAQVNNGYSFDGVDDYVSGLSDMGITGFPVTFDFWVELPDVSSFKWITTHNNQFAYKGISLYVTDAKFGVQFGDGAGTGSNNRKNFISTNDVFTANSLTHVSVIVTDINTISLKINNSAEAIPFSSGTAASVDFTGVDLQIGRKTFGTTTYYQMIIDAFKAFDDELTVTEQTDIHNQESNGNPMITN